MKRIASKRHRDAEYFSQMYERVRYSFGWPTKLARLYLAWCAPRMAAERCYWGRRIVDILTTGGR